MNNTIEIRAVRPFFLDGKAVPAGALVHASAIDAGQIVTTGRAEYVNAEDIGRARAASRAADERLNAGRRGSGWVKSF